MLVRWMGAFGHHGTLSQAFDWEFSQSREVAAESFSGCVGHIRHARIGLVVAKEAVVKGFRNDVWSRSTTGGLLYATQRTSTPRTEVFCKPQYVAIICKEHPCRMAKEVQEAVRNASCKYNVPVWYFTTNGKRHVVKW